jgi:hypothetical protein
MNTARHTSCTSSSGRASAVTASTWPTTPPSTSAIGVTTAAHSSPNSSARPVAARAAASAASSATPESRIRYGLLISALEMPARKVKTVKATANAP